MKLTAKYADFLARDARVEFLEGTTASGKTTMGLVKFMLRVAESPKRLHLLCGLDLGTVEKNIINKDLGLLDLFGGYVRYKSAGAGSSSMAHILYRTPSGIKVIYVLGYADKSRWKKALGGQYGCAMVDEVNVADMDFVRELALRCDYWLATLNPDDPALPIYREYVNRSRSAPEWAADTPDEILRELSAEVQEQWTHWYFSFRDNAGLSAEKQMQIERAAVPGTKLFRNKILGLRGRAEGLVFPSAGENVITKADAQELKFVQFSCGVDTSYSVKSEDAFAFVFLGLTKDGKKVALAERVWNNRDVANPVSPSDLPQVLIGFLEECREVWGFARDVFIDSADQASILECIKYKKKKKCLYHFLPAWKKLCILDRLHLEAGWMASGNSLILADCPGLIREVSAYAWAEDGQAPLDGYDHAINAWQYAWMPYVQRIGQTA